MTRQMTRWLAGGIGAVLLPSACGGPTVGQQVGIATPAEVSAAPPTPPPALSWCEAVEAALGKGKGPELSGLHCLPVPNFLSTGFYGPKDNPERFDFQATCFSGDAEAAARLEPRRRPAADLRFELTREASADQGGAVDLGFLGPWAPKLSLGLSTSARATVEVSLEDAEIRLLSSVGPVLRQRYEGLAQEVGLAGDGSVEAQGALDALERCLGDLCDGERDLVMTTKVLAAIPVIQVKVDSQQALKAGARAVQGLAGYELHDKASSAGVLAFRSKERLNVAVLVEPTTATIDAAGTCEVARRGRLRRTIVADLQKLGILAARSRRNTEADAIVARLRKAVDGAGQALSSTERGRLLSLVEALDGIAGKVEAGDPSLCRHRKSFDAVLGKAAEGATHGPLGGVFRGVAEPLAKRITEVANERGLPCAQQAWYRDQDGDGFGDPKRLRRTRNAPRGYVANGLDCFDRNADARPGQLDFFTAHRGDGSYDYDCDGDATTQDTTTTEGCQVVRYFGIPTRCWASTGWRGDAPACGQTGKWLDTCESSGLSCTPSAEPVRRQACR